MTGFDEVHPKKPGHCPDCGHDQFYMGPEGPGCQNMECAECGTRWNVPMFAGFAWQRLSTLAERVAEEIKEEDPLTAELLLRDPFADE